MGSKKIVVNATALGCGGGRTILLQFLEAVKSNYTYIVFVGDARGLPEKDNIAYFEIKNNGWISRIAWDVHGFSHFLKKNGYAPDLFISLQNTSVGGLNSIPTILYLHQPIPFSSAKWSIFKKK
ncbi:glycosyltransferase family 4 protein, partial [Chromobacterium haemolyticum]|uniref:glycosyltransferase family 4 protein n=1 Tax=Chromobacterium haemolyticum TaxID=394935 RepID=UPI0013B401E6